MYIDVVFSPYELPSRDDIRDKTVVVIDVLRATSTVAYALCGYRENFADESLNFVNEIFGCSKIIPVETIDEAKLLATKHNKSDILLAGERFCLKPEGFDLGNSPDDYTVDKVKDKTIIFSTTNGTRALKMAEHADFITTAAFVNAKACAKEVFKAGNDVIVLCAGRSNKTTKEDSACAGLIVELLIKHCEENSVDYDLYDSADIALKFFNYYKYDILGLLRSAEAGRNLIQVNLEKDMTDCAEIDLLPIATEYKNGCITQLLQCKHTKYDN